MSTRGWENATEQDIKGARSVQSPATRSKYRNVKTRVDGITFDSLKEAQRYQLLKDREHAGVIANLRLQQSFQLFAFSTQHPITGVYVGEYIADFTYRRNGAVVVEDVKGGPTATPLYRLKKKLAEACHGITIIEV